VGALLYLIRKARQAHPCRIAFVIDKDDLAAVDDAAVDEMLKWSTWRHEDAIDLLEGAMAPKLEMPLE
jgi:hypothetical protein